jgi:hypothetical protein
MERRAICLRSRLGTGRHTACLTSVIDRNRGLSITSSMCHYPKFRDVMAVQDKPRALHVQQAFSECLNCGCLEHGFLPVQCFECHHEHLVVFRCRRRGFCPTAERVERPKVLRRWSTASDARRCPRANCKFYNLQVLCLMCLGLCRSPDHTLKRCYAANERTHFFLPVVRILIFQAAFDKDFDSICLKAEKSANSSWYSAPLRMVG